MLTVALLKGGNSPERDVSLRSAASVHNALVKLGHNVIEVDPVDGIENHIADLKSADVVFSVIHGAGGEDGMLQDVLEDLRIPFVGSGSQASKLCFDKAAYKKHIDHIGLPVARSVVVDTDSMWNESLSKQPFVLKPLNGGSSLDTFIIRDVSHLDKEAINKTLNNYQHMLLEELIKGTEITVGVLDTEVLPVIEIIPPSNVEFDYENKYNGATKELAPPENVSKQLQKQAQELALKAHTSTGCYALSRTDMIIDQSGDIYILETNTMPGMTDQSLFPKQAAAAGYSMNDVCNKLIALAMQR